jgi:amino acid permease
MQFAAIANAFVDIPAGVTVGINYSVTGISSCPIEIAVLGVLYP